MTREGVNFLRERIANSQRVLALPEVRYPNGQSSHDAHRRQLLRDQRALEDALLSAPKYADGSLA